MKKNNNKKKKIKLNYQRIFCALSIGFTLGCIIFYGTRTISLYLDTKKDKVSDTNIAMTIKKDNITNKEFVNINGSYYFTNDQTNNYLLYSNILWRIVKINSDNSVTLISEDIITDLAYGKNKTYSESYINKWLNNDETETYQKYTGILENLINDKEKYLEKISVCEDSVNEVSNESCKNKYNDKLLGILDITDYVNTGADKSFINNDQSFYLSNTTKDGEIWYINYENKLGKSDGEDIYGIKPTINIKADQKIISGKGSKENPYIIEEETTKFGSYVKLDEDIWRVTNEDDDSVTLMLYDTLKKTYNYASAGYKYETAKIGTVASYLNTTYLNNLSYKDIINEESYSNGYYGKDNDYNYMDTMTGKIKAKVALPTIGDVIFKSDSNDYMTMTGSNKNGNLIYIINNSGEFYTDNSKKENNIVPIINIDKDLLTSGDGTLNNPYERK